MKKFSVKLKVQYTTDNDGYFITIEEIKADVYEEDQGEALRLLWSWLPEQVRSMNEGRPIIRGSGLVKGKKKGVFFYSRKKLWSGFHSEIPKKFKPV